LWLPPIVLAQAEVSIVELSAADTDLVHASFRRIDWGLYEVADYRRVLNVRPRSSGNYRR